MNYAVANFKMNKTSNEVREYIRLLRRNLINSVETVVCPSFISVEAAVGAAYGSTIKIGAQNVHFAPYGAYTGEISKSMLISSAVSYVIIGHSERRKHFNESNELLKAKISAVYDSIKVIFCFGETEEERNQGKSLQTILGQLDVARDFFDKIILAYEPVWAIGTGKNAQADDSFALMEEAKKRLGSLPTCLYGGSVTAQNAKSFIKAGFNGVLVGSASLNVNEFAEIIKELA